MDPEFVTAVGTLVSTTCAGASAVLLAISRTNSKRLRNAEQRLQELENMAVEDAEDKTILRRALVAAHDYIFKLRMVLLQNGIETPEPPEDLDIYERRGARPVTLREDEQPEIEE